MTLGNAKGHMDTGGENKENVLPALLLFEGMSGCLGELHAFDGGDGHKSMRS